MLLVHQMISCPESHQTSIVGRCWDRDGTCASYVSVAQLVCQDLELICCEAVVIPKDIVMGRSAGALGGQKGEGPQVGQRGWLMIRNKIRTQQTDTM